MYRMNLKRVESETHVHAICLTPLILHASNSYDMASCYFKSQRCFM